MSTRLTNVVACGCLLAVAFAFGVSLGRSQDSSQQPDFATLALTAGYDADPAVVNVLAGGDIKTKLGGFEHFIVSRPAVRLNYTAGKYALHIYAQSLVDTTLLIRQPDGVWVGNDNGVGAGHNPVLRFFPPQSGQYDIWVGTIDGSKAPQAKLFITELKR